MALWHIVTQLTFVWYFHKINSFTDYMLKKLNLSSNSKMDTDASCISYLNSVNSPVLSNIKKGMRHFEQWCKSHEERGIYH